MLKFVIKVEMFDEISVDICIFYYYISSMLIIENAKIENWTKYKWKYFYLCTKDYLILMTITNWSMNYPLMNHSLNVCCSSALPPIVKHEENTL